MLASVCIPERTQTVNYTGAQSFFNHDILPNRHGTLDGMVSDEEVEYKHSVDAGEYPPGVHVDLLHLKQEHFAVN